jgi:hypothetical protein
VIDGDDVVQELVVQAPVEQVFNMFTDPRQLVRWIGISADLQPRPGGRFASRSSQASSAKVSTSSSTGPAAWSSHGAGPTPVSGCHLARRALR